MALVGWSFRCCEKYRVYISDAQILITSTTKVCMVVPNIFSIITAGFLPYTKVCISSHAAKGKCQLRGSQVTQNSVSSVWKLDHVTFLACRIFRWPLDVWKYCGPIVYTVLETMMMMITSFENEIPLCEVAKLGGCNVGR